MNNTWLDKNNNEQEEFYTSHVNKIVVERRRQVQILVDLLHYKYDDVSGLNILDLGCGDGVLTGELCKQYPNNVFYLADGSVDMLGRAKSHYQGDQFKYLEVEFTDLEKSCKDRMFNVVFSSNAIHHLRYNEKVDLYSAIYDKLDWGGIFINIDFVLPESDLSEEWQFRMWIDWINQNLVAIGKTDEVHEYDYVPQSYKGKSENRPTRLTDQINQLRQVGFNNVDCFYKYGVNAIFGGTK